LNNSVNTKTGIAFIAILSTLMAFTSLSTDIYLPAMPAMSSSLHGDAALTVTGFLIGVAGNFLVPCCRWGADVFRPAMVTGNAAGRKTHQRFDERRFQ